MVPVFDMQCTGKHLATFIETETKTLWLSDPDTVQ